MERWLGSSTVQKRRRIIIVRFLITCFSKQLYRSGNKTWIDCSHYRIVAMDLFSQLTVLFTGVEEEVEGPIAVFCLGKLKIEAVILTGKISSTDSSDDADVLADLGDKDREVFHPVR